MSTVRAHQPLPPTSQLLPPLPLMPPPPPQQTKKYAIDPIKSRCEKWYLDSESADVHFTFESTGSTTSSSMRLPAHKILLATDSDVFKAMFYGELKESGDIHLTDVSEAAFKQFLQFFYLNEVELSIDSVADLMHLGHKYMVANCIDVCNRFLTDCQTVDNVVFVLGLAMLYEHRKLIKLCERSIVRKTVAVLKSSGFLECNRQVLAHILNSNVFICSEVELFEACMAWVKVKCGLNVLSKECVDEHLGELFYGIRFGSMAIEEFCTLAKKYNAVLSKDFQTITNLIGLPEMQQNEFNTQRREIKWTNDDDDDNDDDFGKILKFDRVIGREIGKYFVIQDKESIIFTTAKPLLTEFTCSALECNYASVYSDSPVQVIISESIRLHGAPNNLLKMNSKLRGIEPNILMSRPILVKPGFFYQISIRFPCAYTCSPKELSKVVQLRSDDALIEFRKCRKINIDDKTVVASGIIAGMGFQRV